MKKKTPTQPPPLAKGEEKGNGTHRSDGTDGSVTRAVNVKAEACDVYVGRNVFPSVARKYNLPDRSDLAVHVGTWGNPFKAEKYGREDAIALFESLMRLRLGLVSEVPQPVRRWHIRNDTTMGAPIEPTTWRAWLLLLKGKRLGCWCKPLSCHADVLVELIREIEKQGAAGGRQPPSACGSERGA